MLVTNIVQQSSVGWEGGEESDPGQCSNTIKRRAKRDRDRNHVRPQVNHSNNTPNHTPAAPGYRRSKSRSKSRSPGREIDRAAIVIVHHHTTCGHVSTSRPRTASPDNLSESSISFHENEVNFDLSPGSRPGQEETMVDPPGIWYDGPVTTDPCVSVCRDSSGAQVKQCSDTSVPVTSGHRTIQYSNWESCRESWFSSGSSELRPSSGSDCPPLIPGSFCDNVNNEGVVVTNCSRLVMDSSKNSGPTPPHVKYTRNTCNSGTPGRGSPATAASTLPRSAAVGSGIRQSSRESGSSSSRPNSRPGTRPSTR